jgi:hypothetical protein
MASDDGDSDDDDLGPMMRRVSVSCAMNSSLVESYTTSRNLTQPHSTSSYEFQLCAV